MGQPSEQQPSSSAAKPRAASSGHAVALCVVAAAVLGAYAAQNFRTAFPISEIDITMDRDAALLAGQQIAADYGLRPVAGDSNPVWHAASFDVDSNVQVFVELERGLQTWRTMLQASELVHFSPYSWTVRRFQEGEIAEAAVTFNPLGQALGFSQTLPEDEPGASLPAADARSLVEALLGSEAGRSLWRCDLARYTEVEHSEEDRTGGRRDHSFTYELAGSATGVALGDGKHRLRVDVAGDKLSGLRRFIHVPEAFSRRYAEMRSANESLAFIAVLSFYLLYLFLGLLVRGSRRVSSPPITAHVSHAGIRACMRACTCTCTCVQACMHVRVHTLICVCGTHTCTCAHMHVHTCMCAHMLRLGDSCCCGSAVCF